MSFAFTFRTLEDVKDIPKLIDFLRKQDLGYPNYQDWVQRTEHEINIGYKIPILAFSEGTLVGDLIYQAHKELPRVRELKNLRIHPRLRGRAFAHFLLKQAEVESSHEYDAILCDVRATQNEMLNLLKLFRYRPIFNLPLYDQNNLDVVLLKSSSHVKNRFIIAPEQENFTPLCLS